MPIRRVGDQFIVNSTATGDQYRPSVTVLSDGRLAVAWSSAETGDGNEAVVRLRLLSSGGAALGEDAIVSSGEAFNWDALVTPLAEGRFLVSWSSETSGDGSTIRARLFDADGEPVGDDFMVNTTVAGSWNPSVATLADGGTVIAWESV